MAELADIRFDTTDLRRSMAAIDKSVDRATMWALREAGRKVKQVSRRAAPVYRGPRKDVPKGRLKGSISSSKQLKRLGPSSYSVTVAPRGFPASAYAGKQEARNPFMRPAYEAVVPLLSEIHAGAWERAMRRR